MADIRILLQTEGAYPFVRGGGVSTWAEMLCNGLKSKVDFELYSLVGNPHMDIKYDLPDNIKSIIKVPLWGSELPIAYYEPNRPFSSIAAEKERTNDEKIHEEFLPLFQEFLRCLFKPYDAGGKEIGEILFGFWKYFENHSYKDTLRSQIIWEAFEEAIDEYYHSAGINWMIDPLEMIEQTFGMRWMYHYLMPLDVPVPEVDVTHSSSSGLPSIPSLISKFEYGTPYIISDHGVWIRERIKSLNEDEELEYHSKTLLTNLSIIVCKAAYYYADLITPVTRTHHNWEAEFGANIDRIKPVINGVDTDHFSPYEISEDARYDRPTVVALTNLFRLKGIETMIKTCDAVRKEIPDVQFLLYGDTTVDPDYTEHCKRLVKDLELEDNFFIEGFHNNPVDVYNKGDISILTSISEGSPYTVLESMSCACPVVATDVGGVREVLEGFGIICQPNSVEDLSDGVIKLLEDEVFRKALGKKSREKVVDRFSSIDTVQTYYEDYAMIKETKTFPLKYNVRNEAAKRIIE